MYPRLTPCTFPMHNTHYDSPKINFLLILLAQVFILSFVLIFTASFTSKEGILDVAKVFYTEIGVYGLLWELGLLVLSCVFLRLCVNNPSRHAPLIASLVMYTAAGCLILSHLVSLLICYNTDAIEIRSGAECLASSESGIRGRNAVYIGAGLLVPSFIFIHLLNFRGGAQHFEKAEEMAEKAILVTTVMLIFTVCGIICIIDDSVWDWKYAYTFLFSLCISAYLSGFSTFIVFNQEGEFATTSNHQYPHMAALFFLQPLLFLEASIKICLSV